MHVDFRKFIIPLGIMIMIAGALIHIAFGYNYMDSSGHKWGSDDAFISYRYAQNLAHGDGLVFNQGERVEGYSNLLYILLITPSCLFSNPFTPYLFSMMISILCLIFTFLIFVKFIQRRFGDSAVLFAAIIFVATPSLWAAVASGLESVFVLLIQLVIWLFLERFLENKRRQDLIWLAVFSCVSVLARADGFIFPILILGFLFLRGYWKEAVILSSVLALFTGLYFLWRFQYYGYWLPNTYYAKVSGPIIERFKVAIWALGRLCFRDGMLLYLILPIVTLFMISRKLGDGIKAFIFAIPSELFIICGWLVYWVYVGGDVYYERFLLLLFPLGISLFLRLNWPLRVKPLSYALLIAAIISIQLIPLARDKRFSYSLSQYDFLTNLGEFIGRQYPDKVIATSAAGKLPYFSGLKTIDMYGLADTVIAHKIINKFTLPGHDKEDMDYVLSRKPDIIATFIAPNLSIFNGYPLEHYNKVGYRLKYLANTSQYSRSPNIIDAESIKPDSLEYFISDEYDFAILEKQGNAHSE